MNLKKMELLYNRRGDSLMAKEDQITESKYYFFDSGVVCQTKDTSLKLGEVQKVITNASWLDQYSWTAECGIPDWEQRTTIMYPNVEYDKEQEKYRMWYFSFHKESPVDEYHWCDHLIDRKNSNNVELGDFPNKAKGTIYAGRDVLCYMESKDGIHWVRPDLGEFYYQDRSGEIIGTNIAFIGMHGLGVKRNENPDPKEPAYLMAGRAWETDSYLKGSPIGVAVSWSEDGFHWEEPVTIKTGYECPAEMHHIRADAHNQLHWSAELGRYVVITRGYTKEEPSVRMVAFMECTDALQSIRELLVIKHRAGEKYWEETSRYWSCPETVLDHHVTLGAQPYSMPVTRIADGYYLGVVSMANFDKDGPGIWNSVHACLAWSTNLKDWSYICKETPFIKNAEKFELKSGNDYGMIYCAAPAEVSGVNEIFYAATPELHYIAYDEIPEDIKAVVDERIPEAKKAGMFTRTTALNIARIRKDRYAGLWAKDGFVTTRAFKVCGGNLKLTADVADGGSLKVEVLGPDGTVICGYGADAFETLLADVTDKAVLWGNRDLSALMGRTVSFRICLRNACIYTIGGEVIIFPGGR